MVFVKKVLGNVGLFIKAESPAHILIQTMVNNRYGLELGVMFINTRRP
jgi:hypothetical protein